MQSSIIKDTSNTQPLLSQNDEGNVSKGEVQPNSCRDWPFAVLFYIHLIAMISTGLALGAPALSKNYSEDDDDNTSEYSEEYEGFLYLGLSCACFAFVSSFVSLSVMMLCSKQIIQFSLFFSIAMSFLLAIAAFGSGQALAGVFCLIVCMMSACYAYFVWNRIPFAACNLNTGLQGVKTNWGVTVVAYGLVVISMVYTLIWMLAMIGVYDKSDNNSSDCVDDDLSGEEKCEEVTPNWFGLFFLFVAYFWTEQVIQNTIHVTVAGTIGTWWFYPEEASSGCSKAIKDSFCRSVTYSFGSICFGSLLVAIVQALRQMIEMARQNDDGNGILLCLLDCLVSIIENLLRYFNKWAYIYVGIYGYTYMEAAKAVTDLFQARGWTTIISDDLISNALSLIILVNGLITGLIGLALTQIESWFPDNSVDDVELIGFIIAFIIGIVICGIMLGVVESAVNAVIVLFAEAPSELAQNHPQLSSDMISAWREAHPLTCGF